MATLLRADPTFYASPRLAMQAPPETVALIVPCNVPDPAVRVALTTVLLSSLIRFPNASSIRTIGCCANATPAVAEVEG